MTFDGLRNTDAPPLRPDYLAHGGAIDVRLSRRSPWPERAMRWIDRGFWVVFFGLLGFVIAASVMVGL